jgi:serine/threonine protein kinase
VEALQGYGAYGAVYRAVRVGQEHSGPVALKVALHSWDKRFGREVELLSRLRHPGVPRLLDRGVLRYGSGAEYAFFVMEWVEGTRLYAWAERYALSGREVYRVLARLARALEAVHAVGGVHRDVKGDNVLVRLSDRSPVLIDFGSCHCPGAERLTWRSLAPFTPEYVSPQACLFDLRLAREQDGYYPPTPADDLFALGVTAYRLVMGEYPPPMKVQQDGEGRWHVSSRDLRPLLERNARVEPVLREWILRLLSDAPEDRGTAAELAQALEAVAGDEVAPQGAPASRPASEVSVPALPVSVVTVEKPERPRAFMRARAWKPWLALAAVGVSAAMLWSVRLEPLPPEHVWVSSPRWAEAQVPDAGTAGVGDTAPGEPEDSTPPASDGKSMDQHPEAVPRRVPRQQLQPDKKGRCPGSMQVAFDEGCWVENPKMTAEACVESGYVLRKGKCYSPVLETPLKSVPTSSPPEGR